MVGQDDEHQGGGHDLRQGARGSDHARSQATVIAIAQHDGQGNEAHGNHRRRHHTGGSREQGTHKNHGKGQTATNGAKQLTNGVEQVLGHAASLQDQTHQGKEGNGQQGIVLHDAENAQRQGLQQGFGQHPEFYPDEAKEQTTSPQTEGNWKAQQQENDQAQEHDGR